MYLGRSLWILTAYSTYMVEKKGIGPLFITADVEPSIKINGQIVPIGSTKLPGPTVGQILHSIMN